jgi:pilus assembly protein Flp/PilA
MKARWTLKETVIRRAVRSEDGQDLAEYAILVGLIALVVVGAVTLFGSQLQALYDSFTAELPFG